MKFKDLFIKTPEPITSTPVIKTSFGSVSSFNYCDTGYNPFILSHTSRGYLPEINPSELNNLYKQSAMHSAIIDFQKNLIAGNGYTIVGQESLSMEQKITLNQLTNQFDEHLIQISMDLSIHNRIFFEVTWNDKFTKIIKLERISPEKVHIDKVDEKMEPTHFLYNYDWNAYTRFPTKRYPKFSTGNKTDRCQIYMYQGMNPGDLLYSTPSYVSSIQWIRIDKNTSNYHESNMEQSLNPSVIVQYSNEPETKEEKQQILSDLVESFAGARAAGRAMVTFSPDKESVPTIIQGEPNKLDKTFLGMSDTIQRQICYSHRFDPQLLGLKTPGSLGNSGDFLYSFNVYNSNVIQPAQMIIENIINKFLAINGLYVKFKFNEADITKLLPTAMNDIKPQAEAIDMAKDGAPVNDTIKNMTAKQHQQMLRIIRQYGKDQITKETASVLLRNGLGLSEEDINSILES